MGPALLLISLALVSPLEPASDEAEPALAPPASDEADTVTEESPSGPAEADAATTTVGPARRGEPDHVDPTDPKSRFLESAPFDLVGGGSRKGDWAVELSGGYPWQRVRAQLGVGRGLTPLIELDSVLARRFRPAAGLGLRWVDRPHVRLTGEILLGWDWQLTPELRKRGPNGELRLRLATPVRRFAPYLVLATRHTLLMDRTTVSTAGGDEVSWSARHAWILWGQLGLAIAITEHVGLDVGVDLPWVEPPAISIPGFHAGVILGGWRSR